MRLLLPVLWLAMALPLAAEMSGDAYQTEAGALTAEELEAARQRLAAEIAAERARAEQAARRARAEAARLARERAARPLGEQLVEARCQVCHDRAQINRAGFGTPGWTMTVMRMQLLNGAELQAGERRVIVGYLAARDPARNRLEWGLVGVALVLLAGLGIGLTRFISRRA